MRCYYRPRGDDGWWHGEALSVRGGREVCFHARDAEGRVAHSLSLARPEVLFRGANAVVSGLLAIGDQYRLVQVDLQFHKPRAGR